MHNKWTIIYSSDHKGNFLHEKHLRKSNPHAQIMKLDFTNSIPKEIIWREPDRVVRPWLKENKHLIKHKNVALVEYDVLITKQLPDIELWNILIGKNEPKWFRGTSPQAKKMLGKCGWWNSGEIENSMCCLSIFCLYLMSRNCVEIWTDKKYDYLYAQDVDMHCEIRFPSIAKDGGVVVKQDHCGIMQNVKWFKNRDIEFNKDVPGIYHPVKTAVQ